MNKRQGYHVRQAKSGMWECRWLEGGKQCQIGKFTTRSAAEAKGRDILKQRDRIRAGLSTPEEERAAGAARLLVSQHIKAFEQDLKHRGRTPHYTRVTSHHVTHLLELAACKMLGSLEHDRITSALATVAERSSPQNANHYRASLKTFCRWCMRTGRLRTDAGLLAVPKVSAPGETFKRHPFTAEQLLALSEATRTRRCRSDCKMNSETRATLYFVMAQTGFRLSEAGSLTPESFDLADFNDAYVTVAPAFSKHRREDIQPIRPDVARELAEWLKQKPKVQKVFPLPLHFERVFLRDCRAAGIVPAEGFRLGTHSFRRFGITEVGRAAGLVVAQRWARHSTPTLTTKYMDIAVHDIRKGMDGLPAVGKKEEPRKERTA